MRLWGPLALLAARSIDPCIAQTACTPPKADREALRLKGFLTQELEGCWRAQPPPEAAGSMSKRGSPPAEQPAADTLCARLVGSRASVKSHKASNTLLLAKVRAAPMRRALRHLAACRCRRRRRRRCCVLRKSPPLPRPQQKQTAACTQGDAAPVSFQNLR